MTTIEIVSHYRLPRDDEYNRYDHHLLQLMDKARSWWPEPYAMHEIEHSKGLSAMRSLASGDSISEHQLRLGIAWLHDCIAFYENEPWEGQEPYEGRNAAAAADFRAVLAEIEVDIEVPA